jgi:hypothetical protein
LNIYSTNVVSQGEKMRSPLSREITTKPDNGAIVPGSNGKTVHRITTVSLPLPGFDLVPLRFVLVAPPSGEDADKGAVGAGSCRGGNPVNAC